MLQGFINIASKLAGFLWGPWTMIFIAFVAIFLTIKSRMFQIRKFSYITKNTLGKMFQKIEDDNKNGMTPFQATTTALASTVGTGNIAGVATALSVGGPGAIFWMWILAFLGMMSKTAEITLAVHYREIDTNGEIHGGPMYYIKKGLGWKPLATLFSIGVLINATLAASLLQPHTVGRAFLSSYNINPYITTTAMAVVTGIVIIGGVKRIGRFCERLVPTMSLIYVFAGLFIFIVNYRQIPQVFGMIFHYAFAPAPAVGGFAGATVSAAIQKGMSRGMLSNEAGLGTAPMAHATARTEHPFAQGMWGAFEVFIDTIIICTITAFAILSTGVLSGGESGIELTLEAFNSVFPANFAGMILSFAILTFCLSSQIGFFIYFETSIVNLFGEKAVKFAKIVYLIPGVLFAGISNVDALWVFADVATGVCAIPNLIAVLALSGVFFKLMKDYLEGNNEYATKIVDEVKNYAKVPNK